MKRIIHFSIIALFMLLGTFSWAEPQYAAHTKVELISDVKTIAPGGALRVAVKMTMDKGWHVYWKNPGDSGLSPTIEWTLPQGVSAGEIHWPFPKRIVSGPLTSYGYEQDVLLITDVVVPKEMSAENDLLIKAKVDWLACQVDCIPGRAEFQISVPIQEGPSQKDENILTQFDAVASQWPVDSGDLIIKALDRGTYLELNIAPIKNNRMFTELYFYPERSDLIDHAAVQMISGLAKGVSLKIEKSNIFPVSGINVLKGVLVGRARDKGSDYAVVVDVPLEKMFTIWKDYSPELVKDLLKQKKAVFIDFTAAWCLTCQLNDRLVFKNKDVQALFRKLAIETVKADWTSKDSAIARSLESYGKNSIPLYVYYPAASNNPEILPELITPEMIIQRLGKTDEIH